jgi:hypothetical protein
MCGVAIRAQRSAAVQSAQPIQTGYSVYEIIPKKNILT